MSTMVLIETRVSGSKKRVVKVAGKTPNMPEHVELLDSCIPVY